MTASIGSTAKESSLGIEGELACKALEDWVDDITLSIDDDTFE